MGDDTVISSASFPSPPVRSAAARRRAGRVMHGVAAVGLVVSVIGSVVAWQLVGRLNDSTRDTLSITIETIDSVEDSINLADQVLLAITESIDTAASTLDALTESFDAGTGVVDEIGDLSGIVGPSLADAAVTLRQLEDVGTTIDGLLDDLSAIPFGPNYQPDRGLGETVGELADEIEKLPKEFAQTSTNIEAFGTSLDELKEQIATLAVDVGDVNDGLEGSDVVISRYRQNIADARELAVETRDGLDGDVGWMRIVIIVGGINFALAQIVPFWVGRELLAESDEQQAIDEGGAGPAPGSR